MDSTPLDNHDDWAAIRILEHGTPIGYWNWRTGSFQRHNPPEHAQEQQMAYHDLGMDWDGVMAHIRAHFPQGRPVYSILFEVETITLPTDENGEVPW